MTVDENIVRLKEEGWCLVDDVIPDNAITAIREGLDSADLPEIPSAAGSQALGKRFAR